MLESTLSHINYTYITMASKIHLVHWCYPLKKLVRPNLPAGVEGVGGGGGRKRVERSNKVFSYKGSKQQGCKYTYLHQIWMHSNTLNSSKLFSYILIYMSMAFQFTTQRVPVKVFFKLSVILDCLLDILFKWTRERKNGIQVIYQTLSIHLTQQQHMVVLK